jgi:phosphoglycolate phosphatase-like HAD superfamily hydrolase
MISSAIFDIDGTLVDSVDFHAAAWQRAFAKFGIAVGYDAVRRQIGKGGDQLMPVFMSKADVRKRGKPLEQYRGELFKREYLPRVRAFPNVRDLFIRVRGDRKRIALASSAKQDEIGTYKRIAGIEDLVQTETSSDDADRSKPHPDIFEAALQRLAVPTANAVVIGDSPYDAEAAQKIGLRTIGLLCGGFAEEDLRAAGATEIYRDPANLLENYDQSLLVRG